MKVFFFICNYILIYSSIFKNLFRRDIGCLIRTDQLFHYLKNNKKQLTNKTKRDLIGAIFLEYSRVPNKSFHSLVFSKNFPLLPSPHLALVKIPCFLRLLLCECNPWTICRKKYLVSKKVVSNTSLKILEVNVQV